jgi:hypothetical protein
VPLVRSNLCLGGSNPNQPEHYYGKGHLHVITFICLGQKSACHGEKRTHIGLRLKEWCGLSESNRHLNLGKVRFINPNTLKRWHLANLKFEAEPRKGRHPTKGAGSSSEFITGEGRSRTGSGAGRIGSTTNKVPYCHRTHHSRPGRKQLRNYSQKPSRPKTSLGIATKLVSPVRANLAIRVGHTL